LVARLLSPGVVAALTLLVFAGFATVDGARAAGSAWYGHTAQGKRPQFRPWNRRVVRRSAATRWRPQGGSSEQRRTTFTSGSPAAAWSRVNRVREPVLSVGFAGTRKPVVVRRAVITGTGFRPNHRRGAPVETETYAAHGNGRWFPADRPPQFRPARAKRKRTYEELHPGAIPGYQHATQPPVYQMAHGLPGAEYGPYWWSR